MLRRRSPRLALLCVLALLAGCGSSRGSETTPAHLYKPNSNQNPEYGQR